jgi:hypothetical protein
MTKKFKWSEDELQRVAKEMYRLMTSGKFSVLDYFPAFKMAQSLISPVYKYSVLNRNTDLLKELKRRITILFSQCKDKVEVKTVLNPEDAKNKACELLSKIDLQRRIPKILASRKIKLLTGHEVEALNHEVIITITTTCPKKWVFVDLETGEQYSSNGIPNEWVKPIRRVTIPKHKVSKKQ